VFHTLLLRHYQAALPPTSLLANESRISVGIDLEKSRAIFLRNCMIEVTLPHLPELLTLQRGSDPSLQLVVVASIIVGSRGLQRLLSSVPWTVHAISVGARDFWLTAKRELPGALRRTFRPDTKVLIVDAYDTVLFPCSRSILEEWVALGKDVAMPAEITCWPTSNLCRSCEERYPSDSIDLRACKEFPNLNSGGYLGTASALAEALDWMHQQGTSIGHDDQENAWHYYNRFPERVALDHRQRIWSTLCFADEKKFRVQGCRVYSDYIGGEVCLAHANGGSRWLVLDPWLSQLEANDCRPRTAARATDAYSGITMEIPSWKTPDPGRAFAS